MNRDELLTKLAMENAPDEWGDAATWTYDEHQFGWNEYQLRRTELINRPSWDDAPEWAQWLAQDGDGEWVWHDCMPGRYVDGWEKRGRFHVSTQSTIPAGHNWRDTLEPRPEPQSDIKTCRHCDIEFRRPHVDGIPDDRCTRCDDEIKALWPEHRPTKTWWTSKTCTQCGHTTAAKVSDDKPLCPGCVALGPDISDGGPDVISGQYAKAPCGSDANACTLNPCGQCDEHEPALRDHRPGLNKMHLDSGTMQTRSKYHREIKSGVWVDVYDVLQAWAVKNPALQHLIKKALAPGDRGHKTLEQDMADIVASAKRAKELES